MKRIGIDFDDILFDFNHKYCQFHNERYGTNLCFDDIYTYDLRAVWNIDMDEAIRRVHEFISSQMHDEVIPVSGSVETIKELRNYYELHLITSREEKFKDKTLNWLNKHFFNLFHKIHFTNFFGENKNKKMKSEVCIENGIELMIEDAPIYAIDLAEKGIEVLLLDKPWNRVDTHPLVKRVYDWKEIEKILK
jgi:uncharacterized HAD superfamily protein